MSLRLGPCDPVTGTASKLCLVTGSQRPSLKNPNGKVAEWLKATDCKVRSKRTYAKILYKQNKNIFLNICQANAVKNKTKFC